MRNLLMILVLANVLYFMWAKFSPEPVEPGVILIDESKLAPPLDVTEVSSNSDRTEGEGDTSVGAVLGSGTTSNLVAVVGKRSCITVGPFRSSTDAADIRSNLSAQDLVASVRATQANLFVAHWVLISDIDDKAAGDQMVAKLHDGGMGDAYLTHDEEEGFRISLGLFGEIDGAEKTELQAKSLGLAAEVKPRFTEATVSYVDVALPPGTGASAIIEEYGEDKVLLRGDAACPRTD